MHKFLFNRIFFLLIAIGLLINWGIAQANTPMTLRVGVYKNPPLVDTDSMGRPGGLFIDILEQIAHQEGWKVRYVLGTWSDQLYRLSAGKIDLLPAIAINDSRKKRFLFSDQTVIANWGQIYVAENSDIQTIADLHEKNIAVLTDDVHLTSKNGLHEICNSFGIECRTQKYATYDMVMRAIASGRADAGLI
ncbi:MAG: transporter substrate-binding domain-containing protein, partial [Candidatus Thiodiazotropha endolucinida]|nr:transporter substrate-binding domain-containing protein [Candidatus Thiodiazotropha taylori]MCW4323167.1 transporter substrate-binding domain-containing protein [Candidatus Thiodiazotropha taylori]